MFSYEYGVREGITNIVEAVPCADDEGNKKEIC